MADVADAVFHHRQPGQPEAESETAVLVRVDAAELQNPGMHQAAGNQLDPAVAAGRTAGAAAEQAVQVEFETRFDEWKKTGPEPDFHVPLEHFAEQRFHHADQVGHGNILVDHQSFALEKRVFVARVDRLITETATGKNAPERSPEPTESPNLVGRGVRPEQHVVLEPERVLHVPGRMVRRDVDRLEIVELRFRFRTVKHNEAHALENLFQFELDHRDRMQRAQRPGGTGHGQVDRPYLPGGTHIGSLSPIGGVLENFRGKVFELVELLTKILFFLRRELAEVGISGQIRDKSFAPQIFNADRFDLVRRVSLRKIG